MEITVEEQSSVKKILHIEIPEDKVKKALDTAYNELKRSAKVKGFRPGKTPRSTLERMFKKNVHADVTSKLIQDSLIEAVQEKELPLVGQPNVDPPELDPKGPYKYDAVIEVRPELDDIDFKGLNLKKTLHKASDEEVDAQLQMLRKNMAQLKTLEKERPAKEDDFVIIDYEGLKDGEPFAETPKTENYTLKIGTGLISKEFDEQITGMRPAEQKTFTIHFPEDNPNENLADQEISFDVTLKEIKEEILPELNDDLAKQLGEFTSLDELKEKILTNVQEGYDKRIEQELNEQIFSELISKKDFEVPETMINYELESIIADAERAYASRNLSLEQFGMTKESLSGQYRETAEKQVKRFMILGKIVDQEDLTVSDEELEEGFNEMAASFNQPAEEIKRFYREKPENLDYFKQTLLEKQAISLIIDNSSIEEVAPEDIAQEESGEPESSDK